MCVCACAPRPAPECSWVVVFCENRGLGGVWGFEAKWGFWWWFHDSLACSGLVRDRRLEFFFIFSLEKNVSSSNPSPL